MMRYRRIRRTRGMLLIELLVVLLLFAALWFVSSTIIAASLRAQRSARERVETIHRVDNALDALRRDVWSATAMRVTDTTVYLEQANGATPTWTYADGVLERKSGDAPPRVWGAFPELLFSGRGAVITVTVRAGSAAAAEQISFVSQKQFAGGER